MMSKGGDEQATYSLHRPWTTHSKTGHNDIIPSPTQGKNQARYPNKTWTSDQIPRMGPTGSMQASPTVLPSNRRPPPSPGQMLAEGRGAPPSSHHEVQADNRCLAAPAIEPSSRQLSSILSQPELSHGRAAPDSGPFSQPACTPHPLAACPSSPNNVATLAPLSSNPPAPNHPSSIPGQRPSHTHTQARDTLGNGYARSPASHHPQLKLAQGSHQPGGIQPSRYQQPSNTSSVRRLWPRAGPPARPPSECDHASSPRPPSGGQRHLRPPSLPFHHFPHMRARIATTLRPGGHPALPSLPACPRCRNHRNGPELRRPRTCSSSTTRPDSLHQSSPVGAAATQPPR